MTERTDLMIVENDVLLKEVGRLLSEGHEVVISTKGNSMLPFIVGERDSVALVKQDPKLDDIALAQIHQGAYVLHRIVALEGEEVTLMGDGNLEYREHCRKSDVLGIVTAIVKPGGERVKVPSGKYWARLKPFRRYLLAIYRRINKIK